MNRYWVLADQNRYGPTDVATLQQWAREGRVTAAMGIYDEQTGQTLAANQFPELAGVFQIPAAFVQPQGAPQPIGYGGYQPATAAGHQLSEFPVWAIVLLDIFVPLFSLIWFNLMHGQMPRLRSDDPEPGKAIGFSFIPFFNIWYWNFVIYPRLLLRINEQRVAAGLAPANLQNLVMAMCIVNALIIPFACIPFLNILVILSMKIIGAICFAQIQQAVNELVTLTKPAGFAVR